MVEEKEDGTLRPVVMDFGLARDQSSEEHLTMTGMVMGTPAYMSPEQAAGEVSRIDRRSDVYSLGAMLYELLSGRLPFAGATTVAMILQVVQTEPTALRKINPEIPADLETIVTKAMAKEIHRRYETARALAEDLQRFLSGEPILARKASLIYVVYKRAQKHSAMVAVSMLCLLSVIALLAVFVRGRILAARERSRAERQSAFSQQLGRDITQMELFMRAAYLLPAHDIRRERRVVQAQMDKISAQLPGLEIALRGPAHYALGRGHYVLNEYDAAQKQLEEALRTGYDRPEVHFTLGLALGYRYQKKLGQLRSEVDPQVRKQLRAKLDAELLTATRKHLAQSVATSLDSPKLAEGWIQYYQDNLPAAQQAAEAAATLAPWDYEPLQLQLVIAIKQTSELYLQGKLREADAMDQLVAARIHRLADMARSDPLVFEYQVAHTRQRMFRDLFEHRPMRETFREMMAALEQLRIVLPESPSVPAERAGAYAYLLRQQQEFGEDPRPTAKEAVQAIEEAERAGASIAAMNLLRNNILLALANYADTHGEDPRPHIRRAAELLEAVVHSNHGSMFTWNDLCATQCMLAQQERAYGADPMPAIKSGLAACQHAISLAPQVNVGYQNEVCLYLQQVQFQIQSGATVDFEPLKRSLALSVQKKPGDAESINQEAALHVLQARALAAAKQDPQPALQAAERAVQAQRSAFPDARDTYLSLGSLLEERVALTPHIITESELLAGLQVMEEGVTRLHNDSELRFSKVRLLLALAERRKGSPAPSELASAVTMLDSLRSELVHRAAYHAVTARAKRMAARYLRGSAKEEALRAAQQAAVEARRLNPLESVPVPSQ